MKKAYHVTPKKNMKSILKKGFIPQIGENSKAANENNSSVYLFKTLEDADTALGQWLGEIYEDLEDDLVIFEIKIDDLDIIDNNNGFEIECRNNISPKNIIKIMDEEYKEIKINKKNKYLKK